MRNFKVKLIETFTVTRETIVDAEADSIQEAVELYSEGQIAAPDFDHPSWAEFWSPNEQCVVGAMLPATVDTSPPKEACHGPYGLDADGSLRKTPQVSTESCADPHELSGLDDDIALTVAA